MWSGGSEEDAWISVSDVMSVLMVVFLFISIALLITTSRIAEAEIKSQKKIEQIKEDIKKELKGVGHVVYTNGTDVKIDLDIKYKSNESRLSKRHMKTMEDLTRRLGIVNQKYSAKLHRIRIEGHTSSIFRNTKKCCDSAFLCNMDLSQDRAYNILRYIVKNSHSSALNRKLIAVGKSSSELIFKDGNEDVQASQRVEVYIELLK